MALRAVRHERIGQTLLDHLVDERLRAENARIDDDRKSIDIAQPLDQVNQRRVLHLVADERIARACSRTPPAQYATG